ncbi:hypothetical protein M5K25_005211 [Dendrobium thyrsiflorum]|uniref:Uncharacterized protein n=1 Tax=Dendrobium thyrsiflorum TaxID=117978 RepID=A0ABD0VPC1_DENTH
MDWFCPSWESSDILRGLERFAVDDQAGNLVLDANNLDRLSAIIAASIRLLGHTYLDLPYKGIPMTTLPEETPESSQEPML